MGWFKRKEKKKTQTKVSRTAIINTEYGTVKWPERDYVNFSKESYMKNVISYKCINYIASSFASVKWGLFKEKGTEREEITNTPMNQILKRANPEESFTFVTQKLISYLLIAGTSYLERIKTSSNVVKELYALRPDKINIKLDENTGLVQKYTYNQKINFEIDPVTRQSDLLQLKTFHPLDDYFGLSVTEPLAREIDSSNEATEWQKKVFENEGRPGMAVFVHGFLTDEQWDRLEKQLKDNHGGAKNAGKTMIIEGESTGDLKPYSWNPKEMDWLESNREFSRKICIGYGVPPMLLGIPGDNTYSNMKEAREAFWEETIIYYLNLLKGELNNWFFTSEEPTFIDYDISGVPAMAYKQEIVWTRVKEASFLTVNEKREATGYERKEGGDVILVPMGMTTLTQLLIDNSLMDLEINEVQDQEDAEEEVKRLIVEGYDENIARLIVGDKYE